MFRLVKDIFLTHENENLPPLPSSSEQSPLGVSLCSGYFCDKSEKVASRLLSYYASWKMENNLLLYSRLTAFFRKKHEQLSILLKQNIEKVYVS